MGRNASIMHTSRTGKQEITDQYLFKKKIAKNNLINNSNNNNDNNNNNNNFINVSKGVAEEKSPLY